MTSQQPQMSRRDWFRLRVPASQPSPQPKLGDQQQTGLQPLDEPVNHGQVDLASLPPMHEAVLDAKDVALLFTDIKQHAKEVTLIARNARSSKPDQAEKLAVACEQLLTGKVSKLQIRYHWTNARWIDTLQHVPGGFRLVRIQHI
jgi:hypothetical protein